MSDLAARIAMARAAVAQATPGPWEAYAAVENISEEGCLGLMTPDGGEVDVKSAALLVPLAVNALPALLDAVEAAGEMRDAFVTLNEYKEDADWGRCEDAQAVLDAALAKVKEVLP